MYACEPIADITATYTADTVHLNIGEQNYSLAKVTREEENIAAIYTAEQGIDGQNGMQWLVSGDKKQAKIRTLTLDYTAKPADEVVLHDCAVVDSTEK